VTPRKAPAQILPADYAVVHVAAFQALERGDATEHQQKVALAWLIEQAAGYYDISFSPESDRLTSFAEGRRFVGSQVVKLLRIDRSKMEKE